MKRILCLLSLALCGVMLANCKTPPPTEVHHYHTNTRTVTKSASVGGSSSSPEGFQAVTPPSSYSR